MVPRREFPRQEPILLGDVASRDLLTPAETAQRLQVSRQTVLRLARARELPPVLVTRQLVRFRPADVERFVRGRVAS